MLVDDCLRTWLPCKWRPPTQSFKHAEEPECLNELHKALVGISVYTDIYSTKCSYCNLACILMQFQKRAPLHNCFSETFKVGILFFVFFAFLEKRGLLLWSFPNKQTQKVCLKCRASFGWMCSALSAGPSVVNLTQLLNQQRFVWFCMSVCAGGRTPARVTKR